MSILFPFPSNPAEAFGIFLDEPDLPKDCHRHCLHWDEGEPCCDCGERPNPEDLEALDALDPEEDEGLVR